MDDQRTGPPSVAMQGYMMKKKHTISSTRSLLRSIGLKWVMRYFILYQDGKMVYYRERPEGVAISDEADGVICMNIGECQIDRVTAADLAGKEDAVANSFYITVPHHHGSGSGRGKAASTSTLLVTNGPGEFKNWILSFRQLEAAMLHGVDHRIDNSDSIKEIAEIPEEEEDVPMKEIVLSVTEEDTEENADAVIHPDETDEKVRDVTEGEDLASFPVEEIHDEMDNGDMVPPAIEGDLSVDTLPTCNARTPVPKESVELQCKGDAVYSTDQAQYSNEEITAKSQSPEHALVEAEMPSNDDSMDSNPFAIPPGGLVSSPDGGISLLATIAKAGCENLEDENPPIGSGENAQETLQKDAVTHEPMESAATDARHVKSVQPMPDTNSGVADNAEQQTVPDPDTLGRLIEDYKMSDGELANISEQQQTIPDPDTLGRLIEDYKMSDGEHANNSEQQSIPDPDTLGRLIENYKKLHGELTTNSEQQQTIPSRETLGRLIEDYKKSDVKLANDSEQQIIPDPDTLGRLIENYKKLHGELTTNSEQQQTIPSRETLGRLIDDYKKSEGKLANDSEQQTIPGRETLGRLIDDYKISVLTENEIDRNSTGQVKSPPGETSARVGPGDEVFKKEAPEVLAPSDYRKVLSSHSIATEVSNEEQKEGGPSDEVVKRESSEMVAPSDYRKVLSSHSIATEMSNEEQKEEDPVDEVVKTKVDKGMVIESRKEGVSSNKNIVHDPPEVVAPGDYRKVLSSCNIVAEVEKEGQEEDDREGKNYLGVLSSVKEDVITGQNQNQREDINYRSMLSSPKKAKEVVNSGQNENNHETPEVEAPSDYRKFLSSRGFGADVSKEHQNEKVPQDSGEAPEIVSPTGYRKKLSSVSRDVVVGSVKGDQKEDSNEIAEVVTPSDYRKVLSSQFRGSFTPAKEDNQREEDPSVIAPNDYRKLLSTRKIVPKMAKEDKKVDDAVRPIANEISLNEEVVRIGADESGKQVPVVGSPTLFRSVKKTAVGGKVPSNRIKVFAHGNTYDEMEKALDCEKTLFGILATSLDEMKTRKTYMNEAQDQSLAAFSIEYAGSEAHYSDDKDYLHEIGAFCKHHCHFEKINPIVYDKDAKEQILKVLGKYKRGAKKESLQTLDKNISSFQNISLTSNGMTAYKHALSVSTDVPNGNEILNCVRQPLGTPYNWVLFEPSKEELVVENGGSGGVMEMTKVLQESYSDRVLFGMVRISFMGSQFGRRQFWSGLEWKGEDCYSVKMMRQFRECSEPITKMIGDRSFTLSNIAATEMTPEMVIERIKRSCNVADFDLTVEAMKNALDEEQKAIKTYWDKLEVNASSKKAAASAAGEENMKRKEVAPDDLLDLRRYKWSNMSATELVEDLGKEMSGWVLLEVDV